MSLFNIKKNFSQIRGLKSNPTKFLYDLANSRESIIPFRIGLQRMHLVNHPDVIRHILGTNHDLYYKSKNMDRFKPYIGEGLLTSNGDKWKKHRKIIQPVFDRSKIQSLYGKIIEEEALQLIDKWSENPLQNVNITQSMVELTFSVIIRSIFNLKVNKSNILEINNSVDTLLKFVGVPTVFSSIKLLKLFNNKKYNEVTKAHEVVDNYITKLINEHRGSEAEGGFIKYLVSNNSLTMEDIKNEVTTMIFAGYETTSVLLQGIFYYLGKYPDIQQNLRDEINSNYKIDLPWHEQVHKLEYLNMVIKEVLRLFPPFWAFARRPISDDIINGYHIKKNDTVIISPYTIHRHPDYWNNPTVFNPENFSKENEEQRNKFVYLPFALGPRKCIGHYMAMTEALIITAVSVINFSFELVPQSFKTESVITLKFQDDIKINLKRV